LTIKLTDRRKGKAFDYLEEAIRLGFREVEWLKADKGFESLYNDPRWERIIKKLSADEK
jgi:hypothetical protein